MYPSGNCAAPMISIHSSAFFSMTGLVCYLGSMLSPPIPPKNIRVIVEPSFCLLICLIDDLKKIIDATGSFDFSLFDTHWNGDLCHLFDSWLPKTIGNCYLSEADWSHFLNLFLCVNGNSRNGTRKCRRLKM